MDIGALFHVVLTAVVFVTMLSLLVAAHEYGHYLFARLFGMGVEEFAIGMGRPKVCTWMRKSYEVESIDAPSGSPHSSAYPTDGSSALQPGPGVAPANTKLALRETTDFTIRAWPVGGFVRIKGMLPEEDGSETKLPGGFYSKAPWKRFIVLLAGPVFSVLAGVVLLFGLYVVVGRQVPVGTVLDEIMKDGPAAKAGLRAGDRITEIDGRSISMPFEVAGALDGKAGTPVEIKFNRGNESLTAMLTPELEKTESPILDKNYMPTGQMKRQAKLLARWAMKRAPIGVGEAFVMAVEVPVMVVSGFADMIRKPSKIKDNVGGPGSIAKATSDATREGIANVIFLAAMLSISLGIFNLLPVSPLDGGQMLVAFAEMLRGGKRLSLKVQSAVAAVGLTIIMMMVVSIIFIDVGRLTKQDDSAKGIEKPASSSK